MVLKLRSTITLLLVSALSFSGEGMNKIVEKTTTSERLRIGGIQSLSTAIQDDKTILIIGHTHDRMLEKNPLKLADQDAKNLILAQVEQWSKREQPIAFITFESTKNCEQASKSWKKKSTSRVSDLPLAAALVSLAGLPGSKYGNFHVLCLPPFGEYDELEINPAFFLRAEYFPDLAEQADLPAQEVGALDTMISICTLEAKKRFFGKNSSFSRLCVLVNKTFETPFKESVPQTLTIKKYYELLDFVLGKTGQLAQNSSNSTIRAKAQALTHWLEQTREDAESYLALYNVNSETDTLAQALFTCIRTHMCFKKAVGEFAAEMTAPLIESSYFLESASIVEQAGTFKRIIIIPDHNKVLALNTFLTEAGFDITVSGDTPPFSPGGNIVVNAQPFPWGKVRKFLSGSFGGQETDVPPAVPDESILTKHMSMQETEDPSKGSSERPTRKLSQVSPATRVQCFICQKILVKDTEQLLIVPNNHLCSLTCLVRHSTQKLTSSALLSKEERTDDENAVLIKVAALCYLRFLILSPLIILPETFFYSLPLEELEKKLTQIRDDSSWSAPISIAKELFINVDQILGFIKVYAKLKDNYIKDSGERRKVKNRTMSVFDPEGVLSKLHEKQFADLIKALSCAERTPLNLFPRFYYMLAKKFLNGKVLNPESTLKPILA